jgi:hypothetical protein
VAVKQYFSERLARAPGVCPGISLFAGQGGLYLLAFGMLLGIALQVAAAWTLVVEAGKHTRQTIDHHMPGGGEEQQATGEGAGEQRFPWSGPR